MTDSNENSNNTTSGQADLPAMIPVDEIQDRRDALARLAESAGFHSQNVAFVTAFLDRENSAFRRCISTLAWGSFAWFASEPSHLVALHDGTRCQRPLGELLPTETADR